MASFCDSTRKNLSLDRGTTGTGETFAHNDGSWPCLKGVNLTNANSKELHYVVPSGYFEDGLTKQPYHMSLQTIPLEDRDLEKNAIQGFPTYTLYNGQYGVPGSHLDIPSERYYLAEQSVAYTSTAPALKQDAALGLGSTCYRVDSCADSTFDPPTLIKWSQFAFTATVPGDFYGDDLVVTTEQVKGTDSMHCQLDVAVDCSASFPDEPRGEGVHSNMGRDTLGCLTESMAGNSDKAFGKSQCLCYGNPTDLAQKNCTSNGGGGSQRPCDELSTDYLTLTNTLMSAVDEVPRTAVSANFRDGYQRLQAETGTTTLNRLPQYLDPNTPSACWGQGAQGNVSGNGFLMYGDTGQVYTGYVMPPDEVRKINPTGERGTEPLDSNSDATIPNPTTSMPYNVPQQVTFTNPGTCAPPPSSMRDANAMVMMDVADGDSSYPVRRFFTNVRWRGAGPKPVFAQSNGDYVQSFNVVARMPTCLSTEDALPSESTTGLNQNFKSLSCYDTDVSYNPWKWTKNQDLGYGTGAYAGGSESAVQTSAHASWPSLRKPVDANHPDIVVRLAFANSVLVHSATGIPTDLKVDSDAFQDNLVALWGQNKPGDAIRATDATTQSILTADMRAIAFYEYVAAVLYRGLYASYVSVEKPTDRWFTVSRNLIQTGIYGPYGAPDYLRDYFTEFLPAFAIDLTSPDPQQTGAQTVQRELASLSQSLVANAEQYFRYPRIRYDSGTQTFWLDFYCDLFTHLNLRNKQGGSLQQYARNMFQDSQIALIQVGTARLLVPNSRNTAPDITLTGNSVHDQTRNLTWHGSDLEFVTSYFWTQQIESLSAVSMIYLGILGTQPVVPQWLTWFKTMPWTSGLDQVAVTGVPRLVYSTEQSSSSSSSEGATETGYQACLSTKPLTAACRSVLCPSVSQCLCDYSITLDSVVLNPAASVYFNNSNGACACLANPSYPVGANSNQRALNPVTMCFSKACAEYGFEPPELSCASQGCASLVSAVNAARTKLDDGSWTSAFGFQGTYLDTDRIESTCDVTVKVKEVSTQQVFQFNWYAVASLVCLALTVPLAVGLDYAMHRTNRGFVVYGVAAVGGIVLSTIGALLVVALAGARTCIPKGQDKPVYDYDNLAQGRCVDRLTGSIDLSEDTCNGIEATFCQCDQAESVCGGYFGGNGQCAANHMCCVCPNSCFAHEITSDSTVLPATQVSSSLLVLGISVFLLLAAVVAATVPAAIGKPQSVWNGKTFVDQPGRGLLVQWLGAGALIAAIGGGLGAGIYYGSKYVPVTTHAIYKKLQAADLSLNQACI